MTSTTGAASSPGALLSASAFRKTYGAATALGGADFALRAGEIVAVMGPSGSGKSTLLQCLGGIVPPDGGTVDFGGQELSGMSDARRSELRRSAFGFVFQFGQLVPELTCVENVALPLRSAGMDRRNAETRAAGWMGRLEIEGVSGRRPGQVSGGQGQRVAIARALAATPRVIFADEPTGALDSLNGERVMELLTDAVRDTGAALVLVTHESRVVAYSDREVVRDGKVKYGSLAMSAGPVAYATSPPRMSWIVTRSGRWKPPATAPSSPPSATVCCCACSTGRSSNGARSFP